MFNFFTPSPVKPVGPIQQVPEEVLSYGVFSQCKDDVPALACVSKKFQECCQPLQFTQADLNSYSERVQYTFPYQVPCALAKALYAIYVLLKEELGMYCKLIPKDVGLRRHDTASYHKADACLDDYNLCCFNQECVPIDADELVCTRRISPAEAQALAATLRKNITNGRLQNRTRAEVPSRLTRLPDCVVELKKVQTLDLSGCRYLVVLPASLGELPHLRTLDVSGNSIQSFPPSLGNIPNLTVIQEKEEESTCVIS